MIDKSVFTREMTLLHERFGRQPSGPVIQRYYDTLGERLTTEEFEAAARFVFDNDQYWPAPMRFVDLVRGNDNENARFEWQKVLQAASRGENINTNPSGALIVALQAAGGITSIGRAESEYVLEQKRKAFMSAWADATRKDRINRLRLPAPEEDA